MFVDTKKPIVEEIAEGRRCPHCDSAAHFVGRMLDSVKGRTIRIFRCDCGEEQTWVVPDPAQS
jgi:hypothetical protein